MSFLNLALQAARAREEEQPRTETQAWEFQRVELPLAVGRTHAWIVGKRLDKPESIAWPVRGDSHKRLETYKRMAV